MLPPEPTVFDGSQRFLLLVRIKRAEEPHDVVQMQGVDGAVEELSESALMSNSPSVVKALVEKVTPLFAWIASA